MPVVTRLRRWFKALFARNRAEQELKDELAFHLAMESRALAERGHSVADADAEARRRFGGVDRFAEACRDERHTRPVESMMADVRYALRMARRTPGFTAAVVLTLALGIGANAAMFTVVNATLLQTLPFANSNEVVSLYAQNPDRSQPRFSVSYADFLVWRRETRAFADMAVLRSTTMSLAPTDAAEPERLSGLVVSNNFFQLLGTKPLLGRAFNADDADGVTSTVILSHGFWRRRFGGDSAIVGRDVAFAGGKRTVIGVLDSAFTYDGRPIDAVTVLSPSSIPGVENHGQHTLEAIGRLKKGYTLAQAQADLSSVATRVAATFPEITGWSANVFGFRDELVRGTEGPLLILQAAVTLVLLIACGNVAGLLLARGATRGREIALRRALGASRGRLVSQLLLESGVLALIGGALGVGISMVATRLFVKLAPVGLLPTDDLSALNGRVLAFTLVVAVLCTLVVGLWPAFRTTAGSMAASLRDGARAGTGSTRVARFRRLLVVGEIGMAMVLLLCATLVLQSMQHTLRVNPGFNAERVVTMRLTLSPAAYPESAQVVFYRDFLTRLSQQSGIEAVAAANTPPISSGGIITGIHLVGSTRDPGKPVMHPVTAVTSGYFHTMGMQLMRGRDIAWSDVKPTLVVSEASARALWPGEDPIGKRIAFGKGEGPGLEVVGVVNDAHARGLRAEPTPMIYMAFSGAASIARSMSLVVRGQGDAAVVAGTVRRTLHDLDRTLPVYNVQTVRDVIDQSVAQPRLNSALLAIFAVLALVLATLGIYGLVSYSVTLRAHELGVRMALGAQRRDVLSLIMSEGALLAGIGIATGVAGAFAATPLIQSWLFGIERNDPVSFVETALLLIGITLVACYLPARRAMRVDPLLTMRGE